MREECEHLLYNPEYRSALHAISRTAGPHLSARPYAAYMPRALSVGRGSDCVVRRPQLSMACRASPLLSIDE